MTGMNDQRNPVHPVNPVRDSLRVRPLAAWCRFLSVGCGLPRCELRVLRGEVSRPIIPPLLPSVLKRGKIADHPPQHPATQPLPTNWLCFAKKLFLTPSTPSPLSFQSIVHLHAERRPSAAAFLHHHYIYPLRPLLSSQLPIFSKKSIAAKASCDSRNYQPVEIGKASPDHASLL